MHPTVSPTTTLERVPTHLIEESDLVRGGGGGGCIGGPDIGTIRVVVRHILEVQEGLPSSTNVDNAALGQKWSE